MPIALQLYTIRKELAEDFARALRRIREIGYQTVETYPFPPNISCQSAAAIVKDLELTVVAMHSDLPSGNDQGLIEAAHLLQCRKVIWHGWPKPPEFGSTNGIARLAERYNEAQRTLHSSGLEFGLHNHWWEFERIDGSWPYRLFDQLLHPEIFLELDTYWVRTAGLDPATVLSQLNRRVQFLHLKDGPAIQEQPMTALGEGTLDFSAILAAVDPVPQLVVELDECATDIFIALERSLRYLQNLKGCSV